MTVELLLANLAVCLASFVQASVGIGFAMIAVPLLALIDLGYVPGPSITVMMVLSIAMLVAARQDVDRGGLSALLPGLAIGTVAGALLLGALSDAAFQFIFGGIVLAAVAAVASGYVPRRTPTSYGIGGATAGLMGTISGMHGPPLAILYAKAPPPVARATIALIFVIGSALSLVSLALAGHFGLAEAYTAMTLMPGLIAGFALAGPGRALMTEKLARTLMLSLAAASALILIAKAASSG